jgi:nucleolar protein 53
VKSWIFERLTISNLLLAVRHILPKFDRSQLTSAKILAQRSAVPAVFSRPTSSSSSQKRKANVSREDKERLLRIAKRPRKGPFNSVQDTSEFQSGEGTVGLSEAVKASGSYDAWVDEPEVVLPDGLETVHKKKVKVGLAGLFGGGKRSQSV